MKRRLYVGNLPRDANEALLRLVFGQDGRSVKRVEIAKDDITGRPRGHAYLEMASEEDLLSAVAALDGSDLDGRILDVRCTEAELT